MKRGEIWTAAGGPDYAGKPRPVVIVQDEAYDSTESITVCLMTSERVAAATRIEIAPTPDNGLLGTTFAMADKVTTFSRSKLGKQIGVLSGPDLARLDRAMLLFLGLAG